MYKMLTAVIIMSIILLTGCATAPKSYIFDDQGQTTASYETVWNRAVDFFATQNITIQTMDKASGLIVASPQMVPRDWLDCGGSGMAVYTGYWGKFNIQVREVSGKVNVKVNTDFWVIAKVLDSAGRKECNSNGTFERLILDYIGVL